jgi:magnesium transporter
VAVANLVDDAGHEEVALERGRLERERLRSGFFWLDLQDPTEDEVELIGEVFGFHPLAIEDSLHFGQRPKLEEYEDFVFLVVYGWAPDEDGLVEVHCYYSERFLITLRRDEAPAFEEVRAESRRALGKPGEGILVLHRLVDGLVDSFVPPLERFNERLELIEDELLTRPSGRHMEEILHMRRRLTTLRRAIGPQRDLFGRVLGGVGELPGMTPEAERYFRDVYDHLFHLGETIDAYRDLMTSAIDVYLSTASNRLGSVTKQLTVIATIFLPLTFVTGFFGQNFDWMVEHVGSWEAFVALGLGLQLLTLAIIFTVFKKRGWF